MTASLHAPRAAGILQPGQAGLEAALALAARRDTLAAAAITPGAGPRPGTTAPYRGRAGRRLAQPAAARSAAVPLHPAGAGGSRAGGR